MCSQSLLSTLLLEVLGKVAASVLTTAVRPKMLDLNAMLCLHPHGKIFVHTESFILAFDEVNLRVVCVVGKSDVILAVTETKSG